MKILKVLNALQKKEKSLLAFNIQTLDQLDALAYACKRLNKKSICQFSTRYFSIFDKYYNLKKILNIYKKKNLFFFLDHCENFSVIKKCAQYDFDGIMFDGSNFGIKKNIDMTNKIYKYLKKKSIILEAEIGPVLGEEDGQVSSNYSLNSNYLSNFINKANFHLLAIGAGNSHGLNNKTKINFDFFEQAVSLKKNIKLVFHGGSGVNKKLLDKSQKINTVKINFSSELKREMSKISYVFFERNKEFDLIQYNQFIKLKLHSFFLNKIRTYS